VENVPFIDLGPWVDVVRGNPTVIPDAIDQRFYKLLDTCEFLGGGLTTRRLEAKLAAHLNVHNVVTCANGTDALQLALRACGVERGSRVAMPNLTFWATYEAIVNVGATPVLIDIDPDDRQMSFDEFKQAHNEKRFDAAILVHLYGWCSARLTEFRTFCRERRITLIEDGAQAFGVQVDGQSVFADADVATLSFHPAKVLGGIGDGGAVLTKTARVADRVRALANHGRVSSAGHEHATVGWNSRLDAIQATWLLRALDVVDEVIDARRRLETHYETVLRSNADREVSRLGDSSSTTSNGYMITIYNGYVAAAAVVNRLGAQGIEARRIYPHTIAEQARGAIEFGPLTHSRALMPYVISLPLYYGMTPEMVERCVKAYVEAVK
jgi:UDP-2-acetamido-2-deoxy-ribo-hexuluronate aminotransferase